MNSLLQISAPLRSPRFPSALQKNHLHDPNAGLSFGQNPYVEDGIMADTPENPPHRIDKPLNGKSIHRIEKHTAPRDVRRDNRQELPKSDPPGWRRWLSEKMIGI